MTRLAALALLAIQTGCATNNHGPYNAGQTLFRVAFDPDLNFAGDLRPSSEDELLFTAVASHRDDYVPAYSLAIAFRCLPTGKGSEWQCRYMARMLRVGPFGDAQFEQSLSLLKRARTARSTDEMKSVLNSAKLQWLEADVGACEGAIAAMDSVRLADWRPDLHFALLPEDQREIIMHPAMIRVRMSGSYTTTRYQGWVLANGVPAAVRRLNEALEPCWKPAQSARPWEQR